MAVKNITETSVVISGMIFSGGGSKITEPGVYIDEVGKISAGDHISSEPVFSVTISDLFTGTT